MSDLAALTRFGRSLPASLPVVFDDHPGFHRTVGRALLAGSAAGVAVGIAEVAISPSAQPLLPPVVAAVAAALLFQARWPFLLTAALVAWLGTLLPRFVAHPTLGALAAGAVLGILAFRGAVLQRRRLPLWLAIAGAAATTALGAFVTARLAYFAPAHLFFGLPPLAKGVFGAVLGLFCVLGTAAGHVRAYHDPVDRALRRARRTLSGELRALAERGHALYHAGLAALESGGAARATVGGLRAQLEGVALRVIDLAVRVDTVERELGPDVEGRLASEIVDLDRRSEAAEDEVARRQYLLARRTLESQAEQVRRIRANRERVVAALHGQLALLERTRLSLVALCASDSSLLAGEVQAVADVLADVAREMEAESEAVMELTGPGHTVV